MLALTLALTHPDPQVRRATARGQRVLVSAPSNSAVSPTLAFNLALTLALALALTLALARTLP